MAPVVEPRVAELQEIKMSSDSSQESTGKVPAAEDKNVSSYSKMDGQDECVKSSPGETHQDTRQVDSILQLKRKKTSAKRNLTVSRKKLLQLMCESASVTDINAAAEKFEQCWDIAVSATESLIDVYSMESVNDSPESRINEDIALAISDELSALVDDGATVLGNYSAYMLQNQPSTSLSSPPPPSNAGPSGTGEFDAAERHKYSEQQKHRTDSTENASTTDSTDSSRDTALVNFDATDLQDHRAQIQNRPEQLQIQDQHRDQLQMRLQRREQQQFQEQGLELLHRREQLPQQEREQQQGHAQQQLQLHQQEQQQEQAQLQEQLRRLEQLEIQEQIREQSQMREQGREQLQLLTQRRMQQPSAALHDQHTLQSEFPLAPTGERSIGQDMWKQLKRVSIPVFSGDKKTYEHWKATFVACVHQAPATAEYKLLQLRECLAGDALKAIENLGHSGAAYNAALDRLDRKFGGKRRQVMLQFDEIRKFPSLRNSNAADLEKFADLLDIAFINLKDSGLTSDLDSQLLYQLLLEKLTQQMIAVYKRWVSENNQRESISILRDWVISESEYQVAAYESASRSTDSQLTAKREKRSAGQSKSKTFAVTEKGHTHKLDKQHRHPYCPVCNQQHGVWACETFRGMSKQGRWETAKSMRLCFRCLGQNHQGNSCNRRKQCAVNGCQRTHHPLLHDVEGAERHAQQRRPTGQQTAYNASNLTHAESASNQQTSTCASSGTQNVTEGERQQQPTANARGYTSVSTDFQSPQYVTLRTVPVIVSSGHRSLQVNALLDDGSTTTYINSSVAAELGLSGKLEKATVSLLNGQLSTFETMPVTFVLKSLDGSICATVTAKTTEEVTGDMETINWNQYSSAWDHLRGIKFPTSGKKKTVDILIGLDHADLHFSKRDVRGKPGEPTARLTPLGWTCIGAPGNRAATQRTNFTRTYIGRLPALMTELSATLRRFWEIDASGIINCVKTAIVKPEEKEALDIVSRSMKVVNSSYQVAVPWKGGSPPTLPNNYRMALNRLQSTENKLRKLPHIAEAYSKVITSYAQQGYIREVLPGEPLPATTWYLPHFPVIRLDRETTKTRVVFDAAAKFGGTALNDMIYQGPKLQQELFNVLLRFRRNPIALVCDISEMYLRIQIAPADRPYHRFLWRDLDTDRPPTEYEFSRVVFGINASPFMAQFVTQEHARQNATVYPLAAETVLESTYMDDSMDSVIDESTACELYRQLSELWKKAGMDARKWMSNSAMVLSKIPSEDRSTKIDLDDGQLPSVKTLGVLWSATEDAFSFKFTPPEKDFSVTKRSILKKMAAIFDPLGFVAPYVVRGKMILQDLWAAGIDWDDAVPPDIASKTTEWLNELDHLEKIRVLRCLRDASNHAPNNSTLHVFVDASEKAYGTVAYLSTECDNGQKCVRFVASKSHVAPLISLSIPRLEIMAAVLGLRLSLTVIRALQMSMESVTFWSDSMNVLWWIRGRSRQFKPFVANRVGEIQQYSSPAQWRHVPTDQNPADFVSRGSRVEDLAKSSFWWTGPTFLHGDSANWPQTTMNVGQQDSDPELKSLHRTHATAAISQPSQYQQLIQQQKQPIQQQQQQKPAQQLQQPTQQRWRLDPTQFSDWLRLVRTHAWVTRFISNCRLPKDLRTQGELSAAEIFDCEKDIIIKQQIDSFTDEYRALENGKVLASNSKIVGLSPKLDDDGVMRIDGRLAHAKYIPFETRHPIILPRKSWVTQLIIKHYHERANHTAGTNQVYAAVAAKYWIIAGREAVREWEKQCATCHRKKARPCTQQMAPLPEERTRASMRAFVNTGVDYAGPFITIQGRGKSRQKRYLCLFTCLSTRAVHLEMAYGLDTNGFLNALIRMVNRRGVPQKIVSDNGKNFVGAKNELQELIQNFDQSKITKASANSGITWQFNPPEAPHFGGVFESMIKSAKKAIYGILGNCDVTDEELCTAFTGAEALINSRPLTQMSASPLDDAPLTPNHFLFGQCGGLLAPEVLDNTDYHPKKRWRYVQDLLKHVWRRWQKEWIPELNRRSKWTEPRKDIAEGDVVLVIDPSSPRGEWPLARVLSVHPGRDGRVRVATVKVGQSVLTRPITKLCHLDF